MPTPDGGRDLVGGESDGAEFPAGRPVAERRTPPFGGPVAWLTTYGERAGNLLVYSSAYLSFIAMAEVAIVMVLLSLPPSPAPIVVGLVTFAVYANDRLTDVETDWASNPGQAAFVEEHREALYVLASVSYGVAVALSVLGGPVALVLTLLPGVFWVLYASDWIPGGVLRFRRLKEVFLVNTVVVALAWAVTLTFLPLAYADAAFSPAAAFLFAYFFLRSIVDTEVPNVRDVESDRAAGILTLPVVFGVPWTRRVLFGVDFLTVLLVVGAIFAGSLPVAPAAALLVGVGYSLGVTALLGRTVAVDLLSIAVEFEYVVVAVTLAPVIYLA